jgi:hypothetical protein
MPQTAFRDDCVARIKAHIVSGIANDTQRRDAIEAMAVCTAGSAEPLCQKIKKESSASPLEFLVLI